ncbi:DUF6220 domain-containing protein [Paenibacillus alkalitolerans]|uniref:DUF6220 domain-containing protein n=1 Tax=Paenibacillus alkalitolerans TaxID=2799335 RepID=UPI0018F40FBC|nr:DUF6220 domain-containing protein [Paenibacillus alkalitolerans]
MKAVNLQTEHNVMAAAERLPARVIVIRWIFALLSVVLFACVLSQVFFAGLSVFDNPDHWGKHTNFVHMFEFVPLLLFILSFPGRIRGGGRWLSLTVQLLIFTQYATAEIDIGHIAALHPVGGMLIAVTSFLVMRHAIGSLTRRKAAT